LHRPNGQAERVNEVLDTLPGHLRSRFDARSGVV